MFIPKSTGKTPRKSSFVDKYEVRLNLDEGSFARTVIVSNKSTGLLGVAKIPKRRKDIITRMSFAHEIKALRALVHPNIVRLLDVFIDKKRGMTIITEYCPGGNLLNLVLSQASSHSTAWGSRVIAFFRQLVGAVAFMHECHFAHLDLKSKNVVLDASRKVVKLIDFGLAVERSNVYERNISGVQGTYWYMAPEVLDRSHHPYSGGKADVWSLGCVLFEMIKGYLPCSICGIGLLRVKRRMRRKVWRRLTKRPGPLETCLCGEETFEQSQKLDLAQILWTMLDPEEESRADIWQVRQIICNPEQNGERLKTFHE
ncbi:uncharacterized protein LOC143036465 [Oratosquilla oratoria]|uniref:uncharacterized protein LOC143036465 n=1 Tax=Oratosquilla oratoria TaxID=337810 RepID=UPI003F76B3AF